MERFESPPQIFKKSNDLLVMIPRTGALSPISRKLYNVILRASQNQILGKGITSGGTFTCSLSELLEPFAADANDLVKVAKRHFNEMLSTSVYWTTLLEGPGIYMQGNRLYCEWRLPNEVFDRLMDPVLFTQLNIEHLTRLKSYAALALYEICARYKNNPSGLTCACSPDWWVRALTTKSMDVKSSGKAKISDLEEPRVKREWRKVKSASVMKAIAEINEITDLEIDLVEKKTGKAVTMVQFSVRRKKPARHLNEGVGLSPELVEQAAKANVPLDDIVAIVKASSGGESVARAAMHKVQQRNSKTELAEVKNKGAYARAVARDLDGFVGTTTTPPVLSGRNGVPETVVEASVTPLSIAKAEVAALDVQSQHQLANRVLAALQTRGLATPSTIQGHAQFIAGGRLPVHLLVEMARLHLSDPSTPEK